MPSSTTNKADRRQIASEYKEHKVPQGIFAVRCAASGQVWVGSSPNLDSACNRNWFQLRSGLHRNKATQAAWTQHGESSFLFEVVDQFEEEIAELNLRDHMALKKAEWCEVLQAEAL